MRAAAFALAAAGLLAQDVSRLPSWARDAAARAQKETPPPGADAWVLLDRTEIDYEGKGRLRTRSLRLVKVVTQRGLSEGGTAVDSLGGRIEKLKALKGWNLRPDGEVVKLGRDDVVIADPDGSMETSTKTRKFAELPRVVVGSLVAFETEALAEPITGLDGAVWPLEHSPVRRWEAVFRSTEAGVAPRLEATGWQAWGLATEPLPEGGVAANNLPAWPDLERGAPAYQRIAPKVEVRFTDPALAGVPALTTWDDFALWGWTRYQPNLKPSGLLAVAGLPPAEALAKIRAWMNRELIYHKVYLTPERGWLPLSCAEVMRKRSGDCKDLAVCLLGEAAGAGLEGCPVLCAIGPELEADPGAPPAAVFNHVIAAVKLKESLGLPAEVVTPRGRFLLVDATDRYCPVGRLPSAHRGRQVLICTPQGAAWAAVPAAALLEPALRMELEGALDGKGGTRVRLHLSETGNAYDLRAGAQERGVNDLRERGLRAWLDVPATGAVEDVVLGDPLDLDHPFEVTCTVTRPGGWYAANGKVQLDRWGLPGPPAALQKAGVPRRLPITYGSPVDFDYHAVWTLGQDLQPGLPALDAENPFADLHLRTATRPGQATLDLRLRFKHADFGWERREEGVTAWKAYRTLLNRLVDEATVFRAKP